MLTRPTTTPFRDITAVHKHEPSSFSITNEDGQTETFECDYLEGSSVPNQAAGIFWAVVNRLFIIGLTILLVLSEVGWPSRFFEDFMPVFGPQFGVGILGAVQVILTASVLSHHVDTFPLGAAWFLFVMGVFNIFLGLIFRSHIKDTRAFATFREERAKQLLPSPLTGYRGLETANGPIFTTRNLKRDPTGGSAASSGMSSMSHGFGRKGEKVAASNGFVISAPVSTLPKYS